MKTHLFCIFAIIMIAQSLNCFSNNEQNVSGNTICEEATVAINYDSEINNVFDGLSTLSGKVKPFEEPVFIETELSSISSAKRESVTPRTKYYRPHKKSYKIRKALGIPSFIWGLVTNAVGVFVVSDYSRCAGQTIRAIGGAVLNALIIGALIVVL